MTTVLERMRKARDLATGAAFAAVLALPALDAVFGLDRTPPPQEKRQLAARPPLPASLRAAVDFPAGYDAYLRDHFGFRSFLVRLRARAAVLWLGVAPSPNAEVMVGRDGWLFFTGDRSLPYIEGTNPFGAAELRAWERALVQRNDWLARRGIRYLVVFAPGSPSVYPEHLPRWVRPSTHGTRLDQLVAAVSQCPEVSVLDLRPSLLQAKNQGPVYSPTETHWNAVGAWVAYRAMMTTLTTWFPAVQPAPLSTFDVVWEKGGGGDLAVMANIQGMVSEPTARLRARQGSHWREVHTRDYAALREWPRLQEPRVTESSAGTIRCGVIFGDSFAGTLTPFLSEHFTRAVYFWIRDFEPSVIEAEKPDIVIQEYAERLLSVVSPANPPAVADSGVRRASE